MIEAIEKPNGMTDKHFLYLDVLSKTDTTNMWAGAAGLREDFGLRINIAARYLLYWMNTYSVRHPQQLRINDEQFKIHNSGF